MSNIQIYKSDLPAKPEHFASQYTPVKCLRLLKKIDTPALALNSETPSLASIKKTYSEDFIIAYIALWIDNLNDFVNANRKMSPQQIEETATLLYQEYPYFKLADINLVFRKIKKGEFGQLFAELDGVKILGWFDQYSRERMRTAADQQIAYKEELAGGSMPRASDKGEAEKIANIRAKGFLIQEKAKQ